MIKGAMINALDYIDATQIDFILSNNTASQNATLITSGLQAAIDAQFTSYKTVFLPAGTYLISASLKFNFNFSAGMVGEGLRSKIQTSGNTAYGIEIANAPLEGQPGVESIAFENFLLQGTSSNNGGIVIGSDTYYVAYANFNNVSVRGFTKVGAAGLILNTLQEGDFFNCQLRANYVNVHKPLIGFLTATSFHGQGSYIGQATTAGVLIEGFCSDIAFSDLVFESNTTEAFKSTYKNVFARFGRVYFEENHISAGEAVILVNGGAGANEQSKVVMSDCTFHGNPNLVTNLKLAYNSGSVFTGNRGFYTPGFAITNSSGLVFIGNKDTSAIDIFTVVVAAVGLQGTFLEFSAEYNLQMLAGKIGFSRPIITFQTTPPAVTKPANVTDISIETGSSDMAGRVTCTGIAAGSNVVVATVTFNTSLGQMPRGVFLQVVGNSTQIVNPEELSTTKFDVRVNTVGASGSVSFNYLVIGGATP